MVSAMRLRGASTYSDLHLDDVAGLRDGAWVFDEGVRHGRDVHQAVLVHANVDEGAEGRDVGDGPLEDSCRV